MIVLKNRGELDLRALTIMGLNAKANDSAIGYFGTGLKYAVAVFLRLGINFTLFIGKNKYTFHLEDGDFRDKPFGFCQMQGPFDHIALPFTTEYGKDWDVWQAYREIHSNCLDENGEIFEGNSSGTEGHTTFVLDISPSDVEGVFLDRNVDKCLFNNYDMEVYKGNSDWIYYNGIRAKTLSSPSHFTYNIKRRLTLTEDRLLCHDHEIEKVIADNVVKLEDEKLITQFLNIKDAWESRISFYYRTYNSPSDAFKKAVDERLKKTNLQLKEYMKQYAPKPKVTKQEKLKSFIRKLDALVEEFDMSYNHSNNIISIDVHDMNVEDE